MDYSHVVVESNIEFLCSVAVFRGVAALSSNTYKRTCLSRWFISDQTGSALVDVQFCCTDNTGTGRNRVRAQLENKLFLLISKTIVQQLDCPFSRFHMYKAIYVAAAAA